MRPISKGFYRITDLYDGTVDMEMISRCNDTMDLEIENERRMFDALKDRNGR